MNSQIITHRNILKIYIIISIFLCFVSLTLILKNGAIGYEDSIYSNIPKIVWLLIFLNIFFGINLITTFHKKNGYWLAGLFFLISNNILVIMLPVLKGYYFYGRADTLSHIGWIKDTIFYGFFERNNFYPITHVLFSEISIITNIFPMDVFKYMPLFFYMLLVLFIHLFAKAILVKKEQVLLATASGGILFLWGYHTNMVPNGLANFFYPLFIAIFYFRNTKKSFNYNVLLLIIIALFPFFHPLPTIALILTIIIFKFSLRILEKSSKNNGENIFIQIRKSATIPLQFSIILFVAWISSFWWWSENIRDIIDWYQGEITSLPINTMAVNLNKIELSYIDTLELFIRMYGHILIFIIFSVIVSLKIIKEVLQNRKYEFQDHFSLIVIFYGLTIFMALLLIAPVSFGSLRMMSYPAFIAIILGSLGIYEFSKVKFINKKYIAPLTISIILIVPMGIGMFNIFESPYIFQPNLQITHAEIDGYKWTFINKNPEVSVSAIMSEQPFRFVDALYGVKARNNYIGLNADGSLSEIIIPDHFDYANYSKVGYSYSEDSYILLSEYDKHLYTNVWKVIGRYNYTDFKRITDDSTMYKIYSNGGFDTWKVKSLK